MSAFTRDACVLRWAVGAQVIVLFGIVDVERIAADLPAIRVVADVRVVRASGIVEEVVVEVAVVVGRPFCRIFADTISRAPRAVQAVVAGDIVGDDVVHRRMPGAAIALGISADDDAALSGVVDVVVGDYVAVRVVIDMNPIAYRIAHDIVGHDVVADADVDSMHRGLADRIRIAAKVHPTFSMRLLSITAKGVEV